MNDVFCILPWIHMSVMTHGNVSLCCIAKERKELNLNKMSISEIWNSNYYKSVRSKMLKGEKVFDCALCYAEEDSGIDSHRVNEMRVWKRLLGEDYISKLVESTKEDGTLNIPFNTIDLRLGNKCNFQCIFCKPGESISWLKNAKRLSMDLIEPLHSEWVYKASINPDDFMWYKTEKFKKEFYEILSEMRHIIFGGGEPLIIKEHDEILDRCLPQAKNMRLRYHTNGTNLEKVLGKLEKFEYVEIMLSVDGLEEVNEYIRYPSKWENIPRVLKILDETPDNIEPKILFSVCNLNIYNMTDFAQWLLDQNYKKIGKKSHNRLFHPGVVHYPRYLSPQCLPRDYKKIVFKKFSDFSKKYRSNWHIKNLYNVIKHMMIQDLDDQLHLLYQYLNSLDKIRGTSFKKTFPELYNYMSILWRKKNV